MDAPSDTLDSLGKSLLPTTAPQSGHADENGEWQMGEVSIKSAFDSPATHAGCLDFLRKYASDTASHASMAVVLKDDISFPQVRRISCFFGCFQ